MGCVAATLGRLCMSSYHAVSAGQSARHEASWRNSRWPIPQITAIWSMRNGAAERAIRLGIQRCGDAPHPLLVVGLEVDALLVRRLAFLEDPGDARLRERRAQRHAALPLPAVGLGVERGAAADLVEIGADDVAVVEHGPAVQHQHGDELGRIEPYQLLGRERVHVLDVERDVMLVCYDRGLSAERRCRARIELHRMSLPAGVRVIDRRRTGVQRSREERPVSDCERRGRRLSCAQRRASPEAAR